MLPDRRERRLIERFREAIRALHCSRRTEKTYGYWIRWFVLFHGKRHPRELGERLPWLSDLVRAQRPVRRPPAAYAAAG